MKGHVGDTTLTKHGTLQTPHLLRGPEKRGVGLRPPLLQKVLECRGGREAPVGRDCGTTPLWRGGSRGGGPSQRWRPASLQKDRVAQAHRAAVRPCLARDTARTRGLPGAPRTRGSETEPVPGAFVWFYYWFITHCVPHTGGPYEAEADGNGCCDFTVISLWSPSNNQQPCGAKKWQR